jgi:hypothetical protein
LTTGVKAAASSVGKEDTSKETALRAVAVAVVITVAAAEATVTTPAETEDARVEEVDLIDPAEADTVVGPQAIAALRGAIPQTAAHMTVATSVDKARTSMPVEAGTTEVTQDKNAEVPPLRVHQREEVANAA